MNDFNRKIIAIVGPTASGKTSVGVQLAKKFNGEIVSADSRQVFRGLDLGTGKEGTPAQPSRVSVSDLLEKYSDSGETVEESGKMIPQNHRNISKEEQVEYLRSNLCVVDDIPQWMIDICQPEDEFSLFDFLYLARLAIEDILKRGKVPIIVGGTGLYVQGLVEGFQLKQNPESRIKNQEKIGKGQLEKFSVSKLQETLRDIDLDGYNNLSDPQNPHRLIRAIERAQDGLVMSKEKPDWDFLQVGIGLEKEVLWQRINDRVDDRFSRGMLEEVHTLLDCGVDSEWLLSLGLEYRIITTFLLNTTFEDDRYEIEYRLMKAELKIKSHQYARRQFTWFKRFSEIKWESDFGKIERLVQEYIEE